MQVPLEIIQKCISHLLVQLSLKPTAVVEAAGQRMTKAVAVEAVAQVVLAQAQIR